MKSDSRFSPQVADLTRVSSVAREPRRHTFLFADLAGFTALTEAIGDQDAAELAEEFCAGARGLLPDHQAQEVKAIGDALMIRGEEASEAIRLGLRIVHEVGGKHFFPTVRVGMHTGPAVERDGDWFGATVNVAARVSGIARGGEVLVTEATRKAAGDAADIDLQERGRQELRNIENRCCSTPPFGGASPQARRFPLIRSVGWRSTQTEQPARLLTPEPSTSSARWRAWGGLRRRPTSSLGPRLLFGLSR